MHARCSAASSHSRPDLPPLPARARLVTAAPRSKNAVRPKTELEKKVDEALSSANWGASSTLLNQIAQATFD